MLCQLVCVDRRYQRMNCFNIREMQGILKRKFFTDLVNTSDSRLGTDSMMVGMRYKNNMSNILMFDQGLLYNYDLTVLSKYKSFLINKTSYTYTNLLTKFNLGATIPTSPNLNSIVFNKLGTFTQTLPFLLREISSPIIYIFSGYLYYSVTTLHTSLYNLKYIFISNLYLYLPVVNYNPLTYRSNFNISDMGHLSSFYNSNSLSTVDLKFTNTGIFSELSNM